METYCDERHSKIHGKIWKSCFLFWQDATEVAEGTEEIEVGEELENEIGLRFSKLVIKKSQ